MFLVKIMKKQQILDIKHYTKFQNILADIINKDNNIFNNLSREMIDSLESPKIYCHSDTYIIEDADDFEFRFSNDITIYVGKIYPIR